MCQLFFFVRWGEMPSFHSFYILNISFSCSEPAFVLQLKCQFDNLLLLHMKAGDKILMWHTFTSAYCQTQSRTAVMWTPGWQLISHWSYNLNHTTVERTTALVSPIGFLWHSQRTNSGLSNTCHLFLPGQKDHLGWLFKIMTGLWQRLRGTSSWNAPDKTILSPSFLFYV